MLGLKAILARWGVSEGAEDIVPEFEIRPATGWGSLNLAELWAYRDVLFILIWRDVKVRYKQTAIGAAWAVIQPFLAMVVFSLFFGRLMRVPSGDVPYPIFAYAGLLPWQFFVKALTEASVSLVVNERIVSKVYFPRLLVPTAVVLAGLIDFAIAFVILIGMMLYFDIAPTWNLIYLPLFLLLAVMTAAGVSYWLSALDVKYRDVRYTLPFLAQLWLFSTPVVYPSSIVPEGWRALFGINPMVGVVEGFRWVLLGTAPPDPAMLLISLATVLVVFIGGLLYFAHIEQSLTDII
jgi:lipopolysaccharide transport system permease protein